MINGQLDEIDLRILAVLQSDGRTDMAELSRKVNLSRTPVSLRVEKLMEAQVIRRFVGIVDRIKVGRPVLVVTHIKLEKQTTSLLLEFETYAAGLPEVQSCLHVSGDWNFILQVTAMAPQDYYDFLMERINQLPNVAITASAFVLKECKSYSPLPL